ncbi:FkbM family methyltransferase [Methylobacter psychrophilus]|uniref:FkbM family methyltransferase n=1 Tax=Methylobacter psychrophilus TaxID=96941 RepID=UPI0021D4CF4E|nr:FkbM family methyltransferase [Methylobacter psychrophilus]
MITKEDVTWAYRLYLDREPENENAVNHYLNSYVTRNELIQAFMLSEEYSNINASLPAASGMAIQLFDSYCPQLQKNIKIALDTNREDLFGDSFKKIFNIPNELIFLLDNSHGINSFLDVGANIGWFTLSAALMGIQTVAIEAMADNYILLTKAISANSISNVMPFHMAASDDFSLVALQGHGAYAQVLNAGKGDTPGIPLDGLLGLLDNIPDLIKIDVEGHEIPVLTGLTQTLNMARPMLIVEGNSWTSRDLGGCQQLLKVIESYNYDLFVFNQDGTCRPINSDSFQDGVVVDFFAYPRGVTQHRSRPQVRVPSIVERLDYIEAGVDSGHPHVCWHTLTIIDRLADEVGRVYSPRLDTIKRKLEKYSNK